MSESKSSGKVVQNRGQVTYSLTDGPEGVKRTIAPGEAIETLNEKEAKHLLSYHDFRDVETALPQHKAKIDNLQAEIDRLTEENKRLEEAAKHPKRADDQSASGHPAGSQEGTGFNVGAVEPPEGLSPEDEAVAGESEEERSTRRSHGHKRGR